MFVQFNYTKKEILIGRQTIPTGKDEGEFEYKGKQYKYNVKSIGEEIQRKTGEEVRVTTKTIGEIFGKKELKEYISQLDGNASIRALFDKWKTTAQKPASNWTEAEWAISYIMSYFYVHPEVQEKVYERLPIMKDSGVYKDFDAELITEGKTYQAESVQHIHCGGDNSIWVLWNITEKSHFKHETFAERVARVDAKVAKEKP